MADKVLSPKVLKALKLVGENIKRARIRRGITQADLAKRAFMTHTRLRKIEKGDPTVGMGGVAQVLDILGLVDQLGRVAEPDSDELGKALEDARRKKRVGVKRSREDELDF